MQIDDEIEKHTHLLQDIKDNPMDFNAIVARRRKEFTGEFFRHLNVLSETYDSLEDQDGEPTLNFWISFKCLHRARVSIYLRTTNLSQIKNIHKMYTKGVS